MNRQESPLYLDLGLLFLRLSMGILMLTHGLPKLLNFQERMTSFRDPIGLGSTTSLSLAAFAEVFCSVFVILGFKFRWALIPLIITMVVIIFIVHWPDPFGRKELPIMYLVCYLFLLMSGSGKYSLDRH